ncbi:Molybdenum cofactor sulfurase [Mycena indigotica]|uniref:Molybdenum cofactor sulfurase n=1 Tax=Mycena indigotica TaxID=2126181 RepID=A0A8H6SUN6_9AGAR|nr:Molybdenum cofactor sulfurase [Mycena indigotica]KAF7306500.1 Molybdenum cofactor sulfurase [Mycena indigotica]
MQRPSHVANIEQTRLKFFLDEPDYAYGMDPKAFHETIKTEYPSLNSTTYLDHAASTPPPRSTLISFAEQATNNLYSNPHSRSSSSTATLLEIERCRGRILEELFGLTDPSARGQWDVVFTSGATAALKLVGEAFPWANSHSKYIYLKQSHTSLVGVRGCALAHGAVVSTCNVTEMPGLEHPEADSTLFGYAAQCNATGSRLGLGYCQQLKERHPTSFVLLDASAYLSTAVLDLASVPTEYAPDFIACSFYKIVGYPTGLGCLVVKRTSGAILQRNGYFGGGTIDSISVSSPEWSRPRRSLLPGPIHERFEDGTLPFLNIIALNCALETHRRLFKSQRHISKHVSALLRFATRELALLTHENSRPVVKQHQAFASLEEPGPTIGFSILDPASEYVGHTNLEQLATVNGFHIRTGGLCNTGVLASTFNISDDDLQREYNRGRSCWDDEEFGGIGTDYKYPLGMARISFGACSTIDDVLQWLSFLRRYFVVSDKITSLLEPVKQPSISASLKGLMLYPIKSCGGQPVGRWEIVSTGLRYDREWMLVDAATGKTLSQKRYPRMALIRPTVVPEDRVLIISAPQRPDLCLPLDTSDEHVTAANICSDVVPVTSVNIDIDEWFTAFLGMPCCLRRLSSSARRHAHFDRATGAVPILLSNESPFLLISQPSVDQVSDWIHESNDIEIHADCFRANFLLGGGTASLPPFVEDTVDLLRIGSETFQVLARCRRCLMVCVDQNTGCRMKEPFSCLARKRKSPQGKIEFGVHLMWREDLSTGSLPTICVGDPVTFVSLRENNG